MSVDIQQLLLSGSQSRLHLLLVTDVEVFSFKGGDSDFLDSCVQLLGFIITGIIVENGVSTKNEGFDHFDESWGLWIVSDLDLLIWLCKGLVSLMLLEVDRAVELLSVDEHVRYSHSILGEGSGLVRANARS